MDAPTPSSQSRAARSRPRRRSPRRRPSQPYHHGDLRNAAIERGLVLAAQRGPRAITLRGVARDLGVTAPALVYYFRCIDGFRAAVAAVVLERAGASSGAPMTPADSGVAVPQASAGRGRPRSRAPSPVVMREPPPRRTPRAVADAWIEFATANPGLYRLASGDGWHEPVHPRNGWHGVVDRVPSPRRALEMAFGRLTRRLGRPRGDEALARELACTVHGLALGCLDGLPADFAARALDRVVRESPAEHR
jgi:AcrR family transcriptional regulator